ncbi:PREDICTED: WEB family protein At5g55860-like [Nelumbo nucifera]|uniref:WEB family protein At5g55860-like n=1 Tax=Nelumbo nucifera TaxID=4432 RepID=A0A1U7YTU7_NELNU|nr:PREDICTED: WEB family protein At5g55860-like [Nelumbo nucifera]XP_010241163.1 PREDICTED: WEB family protein At5g55860-like [Nelumbo nucifera]
MEKSNMSTKDRQNTTGSPRAEVGEIDTRAPFQSVKDAVNLFGVGAFSGEKPIIKKSKPPIERVFAKETQLHLAKKALNKLKEQLRNAETTKVQAHAELEKAKKTVEDLTNKLKTVNESKECAIKATEGARNQVKQLEEENSTGLAGTGGAWKQDFERTREQYTAAMTELDAAKQELSKIRQDFEASMEAKVAAIQQAVEAEGAANTCKERASELSKEIVAAQESLIHVKLASLQAQEEQANIIAEKDAQRQSYKAALEEAEKKLQSIKKEFDPELTRNLEAKLAETAAEIGSLQKEIEDVRASDLDSVKTVTLDLDDAKEALQKVAEEESSLRSLVDSLKLELESIKKEHLELKEKETETESVAGNLHVKLRKSKAELEAALAEESKAKRASDELISTLLQLTSESENAKTEAEAMMKKAEELREEAQATQIALEEAEEKLQVALKEAEEAKAAEAKALDQIKDLSERTNAARASTSESGANITISKEEFESLSRKVEESDKLAEMKVAAAMAQVEAVKASENEALKRLEANEKEIEEIKAATEEALKRAELAEAAKRAIEGELKRWREREQKRATEAASRILAETQMPVETSLHNAHHHHHHIQKHNPSENVSSIRKMDKDKIPVAMKALIPNLSGVFHHHKKKSQLEGGSPSYLPGEKPV